MKTSNTALETNQAGRVRDPFIDRDWKDLAELWSLRPDTVYLNHGSFGPPLNSVRQRRQEMISALDEQPMDFFLRQYEPLLSAARQQLAGFVNTSSDNLVFVENATYGMNVVAQSFPLKEGDEVLLNDHEYGAVQRIWERATARKGARVRIAKLPEEFRTSEELIDVLTSHVNERTRLLVISHITSPTALIFPIKAICETFNSRQIPVCVDGPHAPAQVDIDLDELGCDFYTASCHKWLCATFGSGFCYAHPRWHDLMEPVLLSWGRLLPAVPQSWDEEFTWTGTRDPSPYLSIPMAIETLNSVGLVAFRQRTYHLAAYAREQLTQITQRPPLAEPAWYGCMAHVPLPAGDHSGLQDWLWREHRIEVPIIDFLGRWYVRVSCHLYTQKSHIDQLVEALTGYLKG